MSGLLPEYVQYMLLEDRGISNMMKDVPCSKTLVPWDNSTNIGIGWTTSKFMYTETLIVSTTNSFDSSCTIYVNVIFHIQYVE